MKAEKRQDEQITREVELLKFFDLDNELNAEFELASLQDFQNQVNDQDVS